jgi:hypothetical protein
MRAGSFHGFYNIICEEAAHSFRRMLSRVSRRHPNRQVLTTELARYLHLSTLWKGTSYWNKIEWAVDWGHQYYIRGC